MQKKIKIFRRNVTNLGGSTVRVGEQYVMSESKSDIRSKEAFYITRNVKRSNAQTLREVRSGEIEEHPKSTG